MTACQECGYTVKTTVTSNGLVIVGLELEGIAVLVGCLSAYSIWRTLKEMSLANQAGVGESLASQSRSLSFRIARSVPSGMSPGWFGIVVYRFVPELYQIS